MSYAKGRGFGFGGFSLQKKKAEVPPPPPTAGVSKHGYSTLHAISQNALAATFGVPKRRAKTEEEYFDEEEESEENRAYQPAPGSPGNQEEEEDTDEDNDPLEAFMSNIDREVERQAVVDEVKQTKSSKRGIRDDIEEEDDEESYYRFMAENPNAGKTQEDSDQEMEYDQDGNPIVTKKKYIDPLPPMDHSQIQYSDFEKNFYEEHSEIHALDMQKMAELRNKLGIWVTGACPPKPVSSFAHFGFEETLIKAIRKSEYTQPTPIQAQGIPVALSGRDIIGIAKTGSGKTAAYIWPMLVHIMDQPPLQKGQGPIGLILAPTRELALQIYQEARRFGKIYDLQVVCCYGGGSKYEQSKALEAGAEIVVATPGRMIDMVKMKATNLERVTYLVLDEADRMFDMGFEPQVRSICDHVRPDRQCLMFSATFKKKVERLARDVLTDPVKVVQGDVGEANEDVTQIVKVMSSGPSKWNWLIAHLVNFTSQGTVLIFVTKKLNAEELANNLKMRDFSLLLLHGDMDQIERNQVITSFRHKEVDILVATDVAARGLDIPHIRTVINFDVARDIDTHTHRVGRTGRAGEKGTAYTLITDKDKDFAGHLVRNLEGANQTVPDDLMNLAMQCVWFRKSRFKSGKGRKPNVGGRGLGFQDRAGLGASSSSRSQGTGDFSYGGPLAAANAPKIGPGTDRLSALKQAFSAQYKSNFCAAGADPVWNPSSAMPPPPAPKSESSSTSEKSRKKSRWSD